MYIIINNTRNTKTPIKGNYPINLVESLLEINEDIIIISLYSNTIKIPIEREELNGIKEYLWKEYPLPIELIQQYKK